MADFAIGISKAAVEALVNKVQSAIKEEAEQWQIVQHDLVFITDEFEMMQSFLNSARGERVKNLLVRTWVRQVRDLSYDVEDCIEFVLHLDTEKRSWWLRLRTSSSCGKDRVALPVDQAVAKMKQLKARVEDVSKRSIRYSLISDSGALGFDILAQARDTVARPGGSVDLTKLVTNENEDLQVIPVWGGGDDLGTMSIMRKMYEDSRIPENFTCRAWVKLTHPINRNEFFRSLVVQFHANFSQRHGATVDKDVLSWTIESSVLAIVHMFVEQVNTHRYLIILEDLSSMVQWDEIRPYLPDMKNGSRIVVSTSHYEIAGLCVGKSYWISELQWFSPDKSICVFFNEGLAPAAGGGVMDRALHELLEEAEWPVMDNHLVGRVREVEKLFDLINNRPHHHPGKPHVVSVWGLPGSGRTAFVRNVSNRCIGMEQFDWWISVQMAQPYHLMVFRCYLLYSSSASAQSQQKAENITLEQCRKLLYDDRCLVIIDGVQSKEAWDLIKVRLISGKSKGCIVVIASEESVAKHCTVSDNQIFRVKNLQDTAAFDLFRQAFQNNENSVSAEDQDVKALLSKSGGLPILIVALGGYLAKQQDVDKRESMCQRLIANFMQELETGTEFLHIRVLLNWMRSYFSSCPPVLLRCMLYLLIFPQGTTTFGWRRLVRRWIAEGYAKGTESNSLDELAGKLFHKLASQGVLEPATMKKGHYQVNGFFQEYMISRSMEEKFFFPLEVSVLEKEHSKLTTEGVGQHLAIWSTWVRNRIVFDSLDFLRLRSLTIFGKWEPFLISDKMKVLRVLDLQDASGVESTDLGRMIQLLPHLKFLSLRSNEKISYLPDSLGDRKQLQTLDIRYTSIDKLPKSITRLRKLQYIRAGTHAHAPWSSETAGTTSNPPRNRRCSWAPFLSNLCRHGARNGGGVEVPRGVEKLTPLHTLGVVDASAPGGTAVLKELQKLTQLHKLGVSGINRDNIKHLFLVPQLRSLSLHLQKGRRAVAAEDIKLPEGLSSLKLYGHVQNLPQSIKDLGDLMKLSLDKITLEREDIEVLGKLDKLHTLRLRVDKVQDEELQICAMLDAARPDGAGQTSFKLFVGLQVLHIACANSLHVTFGEGAMEKLELLALRRYQQQQSPRVSGLGHLTSLKTLSLSASYDNTLREALQQQIDAHQNRPVLELEK